MDLEERVTTMLEDIQMYVRQLEEETNGKQGLHGVKQMGNMIRDCKALIRDWEKEAIADGLEKATVSKRKKGFVDQLNTSIAARKEAETRFKAAASTSAQEAASEPASSKAAPSGMTAYSNPLAAGMDEDAAGPSDPLRGGEAAGRQEQQEVKRMIFGGQKEIKEIDKTLDRAERIVNDTVAIGTTTAGTLKEQTNKMRNIAEDMEELKFSQQSATRVLRDVSRGILTNKCIGCLLCLVVIGLCVVIALKITGFDDDVLPSPSRDGGDDNNTSSNNRRLLLSESFYA